MANPNPGGIPAFPKPLMIDGNWYTSPPCPKCDQSKWSFTLSQTPRHQQLFHTCRVEVVHLHWQCACGFLKITLTKDTGSR
jgi:hypothetical protein